MGGVMVRKGFNTLLGETYTLKYLHLKQPVMYGYLRFLAPDAIPLYQYIKIAIQVIPAMLCIALPSLRSSPGL